MKRSFVVDNSVVMSWCFGDEKEKYADEVLGLLEECEAFVPGVWPLEAANVLLVAQRKKRLNKADAVRFLNLVRALPIRVVPETTERVFGDIIALAHETGLSSYDAAYLDLAMREGLPIATLDVNMRRGASLVGIELLET